MKKSTVHLAVLKTIAEIKLCETSLVKNCVLPGHTYGLSTPPVTARVSKTSE